MEDISLSKKIEHVLDDILPLVGEKRKEAKITIVDFSDSEDDY